VYKIAEQSGAANLPHGNLDLRALPDSYMVAVNTLIREKSLVIVYLHNPTDISENCVARMVARWYLFKPNFPNLGLFSRVLLWTMFVYFLAIWYIL
jgi:hypothetical protein